MPDIYDILKIKNEQGEWITVPALKGEKGDTGETGPQGPAGPAGSYTAGDNITIEDGVISATDTVYDDTEVKADIDTLSATVTEQSSQIATIRAVTDRFYTDAEGDLCEE